MTTLNMLNDDCLYWHMNYNERIGVADLHPGITLLTMGIIRPLNLHLLALNMFEIMTKIVIINSLALTTPPFQ